MTPLRSAFELKSIFWDHELMSSEPFSFWRQIQIALFGVVLIWSNKSLLKYLKMYLFMLVQLYMKAVTTCNLNSRFKKEKGKNKKEENAPK